MKKLYGEPVEVKVDQIGNNQHIYKSKDGKTLLLSEFSGSIKSFMMRIPMKSGFYEEIKKTKDYNDFSKSLDKNSFININGHKIKMYTYFKDNKSFRFKNQKKYVS